MQSTGGSVTLQAGDEVTVNAGGQVLAATTVTIAAAFGDVDNNGFATFNGLVSGGGLVAISARNVIASKVLLKSKGWKRLNLDLNSAGHLTLCQKRKGKI